MLDLVKRTRKILVGIVGSTILLVGILMIVLPGPAIIVIPLGLSILATEFIWAKNLLKKVKERFLKSGPPRS
jgi:uncharacterized protein (TIGR02611 family)